MWCIYRTTNLINGKTYIGQHKYKNGERLRSYLGSGTSLRKAFKKYGKKNFKKEIIEDKIQTQLETDFLEQSYILNEKASGHGEYNIAEGGQGGRVQPLDGELYEAKRKKVICIETQEVFNSIKDVGIKYNVDPYNIGAVCVGKKKSFFGKHWAFYEEGKDYTNYKPSKNLCCKEVICLDDMKVFSSIKEAANYYNIKSFGFATDDYVKSQGHQFCKYEEGIDYSNYKPRRRVAKRVYCYEKDTWYISASDAAKHIPEVTAVSVRCSCTSHAASKNLHFAYENDIYELSKHKKFNKIRCIETGIEYKSIAECARILGIKESGLRHCVKGRNKTFLGYHWEEV